jgi:hypothetical protein
MPLFHWQKCQIFRVDGRCYIVNAHVSGHAAVDDNGGVNVEVNDHVNVKSVYRSARTTWMSRGRTCASWPSR